MDMEITALRPRRRFTVDDYYRMAEAGILREDDRVELIEGEVVEMPPIGSAHAGTVDHLATLLGRAVADRAIVRVQGPVRLGDLSEPVPDVCLLRAREDFYKRSHPRPEDTLLIVEVADTTATFDRRVKLPLYARAGIPEYWVVDLGRGLIEIYRSPSGESYRERLELRQGDRLAPATLPGVELSAADILGSDSHD
jgi:Uma2 family endonuclease